MHLVPFGEYVPLQRLLFFVGPIVDAVSSVHAGRRDAVMLPVGDHKVSTAICYEVIYGSLMRRFVLDGSELLTTITNDALVRAVVGRVSALGSGGDARDRERPLPRPRREHRRQRLRRPYGRVVEKSKLFEQEVLVQDVRLLKTRTVYTRIGDSIAWLSLAFTAGCALLMREEILNAECEC